MKKFLFIMTSLFLSLNLAKANDLLFKASNGALSENSAGVRKLSDEEMRWIRGGYYFDTRNSIGTAYYNSYGQIIYSINWFVGLDRDEIRNARLYIDSNDGTQAFQNYTSFMNYSKAGSVAIQIRYNVSTGAMRADFVTISSSNRYSYSADKFAKKMINAAIRGGAADRTRQAGIMMFGKPKI